MLRKTTGFVVNRIKALGYAISGLIYMAKTEQNVSLHLATTLTVIVAAFVLGVSVQGWLWLIVAVALVYISEVFNTAIEFLCDVVSPEHSEAVRRAKDIAAGAVLVSAMMATIIGAIVFFPYILALF